MVRGACIFGHGERTGDVCPRAMFEKDAKGYELHRLWRAHGREPMTREARGHVGTLDEAMAFLRGEGCDRATLAHAQPNGGISVIFHSLSTGATAPAIFEGRPAA